ncbi:MAG: 2-C-methyl-D-erythritol 4-phosphate cytidylyltransferase [Endomicrobium sp.]|jgi:2-C-methyl-D-erythritol 4-phosphate cytidylyltransferase|uniref:2-C-methyl-D-erythritol 4-phosphate cytidylyltransferase n=1 Tax=Candidatus Endomicrobiellum cubanum TaxID=3242325 RepID=UPI0028257778|nr:2-C-methyl-D-erythritol 4-phosphate cytidylyltransferase [Endomicrobium sp.]
MKGAVIVVAGGFGKRFGTKIPKQFLMLNKKPMFLWSVEAFAKLKCFKQKIVVVPSCMVEGLSLKYKDIFECVAGGKERFDSVKNGLKLVKEDIHFVAIHDGARPLISKEDIDVILKEAQKTKAAIAVEQTKDTIKVVSSKNRIIKTLNRSVLRNAQTPQIFETNLLKKAYSRNISRNITDDSSLVEKLNVKVSAVVTKFPNFKITTKQDFLIAEKLLR